MATSLGIEQTNYSSKLGFKTSLIDGESAFQHYSQISPCRKSSITARRSSSTLSSSKNSRLRFADNRILSLHLQSSQSGTNGHRHSYDQGKRSSITRSVRRSVDDTHLIKVRFIYFGMMLHKSFISFRELLLFNLLVLNLQSLFRNLHHYHFDERQVLKIYHAPFRYVILVMVMRHNENPVLTQLWHIMPNYWPHLKQKKNN